MYMLDTNMCIYAQKKNAAVLDALQAHWDEGICISAVTLAEMEYGAAKSQFPERTRAALLIFLSVFTVMPFDERAAIEYGQIRAALEKQGTPIGAMDTLIAAHARSLGATIVTHNTREFQRVPGVHLTDWYDTNPPSTY